MDVKALLRQYQPAIRYAQKCFRELDEARTVGIRSPRLDGMPRGGGGWGLEQQISRIDALERRAYQAREKALALAEEIEGMIDALQDHDQKAVLRLRYMRGYHWGKIATEMGFTESGLYKIHGRALEELRRRYRDAIETL